MQLTLTLIAIALVAFAFWAVLRRPRHITRCRECHRLFNEWHKPVHSTAKQDVLSREYYVCPQCCKSIGIAR